MNRLLRRYLPKGKNIPWNTSNEVKAQQIEDVMNRKPRKILGYRTPDEVEKEWGPKRPQELEGDHGGESSGGGLIGSRVVS